MALDNAYRQKIIRDLGPTGLELLRQGKLDDEVLEEYAQAKGISPDDFSGVSARTSSTASVPEARPVEEAGFLDTVAALNPGVVSAGQALTGGLESMAGGLVGRGGYSFETGGQVADIARKFIPDSLKDDFDKNVDTALGVYKPMSSSAVDAGQSLTRMADENRRQVEERLARSTEEGSFGRQSSEAVFDVLGSPSSVLSIPGGPFGASAGMDVYNQEYVRARMAGLSDEEAEKQARLQGGIEGAVSLIPAGKFLAKIPGVKQLGKAVANEVSSTAARFSTKLAANVLGEGAEEGVTQLLQTAANKAVAETADDEAARVYAESQLPQNAADLFGQVWRATKAGMVGGGALGGIHSAHEVAVQNANAYMDTLAGGLEASRTLAEKATTPPGNLPQVIDQQVKADEMEAGFRTMERTRAAEALLAPARQLAGQAIDSPMASALAEATVVPVTPAEVRAERQAGFKTGPDGRITEVDIVARPKTAQEAPQAAPVVPATTPAPKVSKSKVRPADQAREDEVRASLKELFPDASDAEFSAMVADEMKAPAQLARQPKDDGTYENKAEAVVRDIASRVRGGNDSTANAIGKLIAKKKLVVVDNEDQIPNFDKANAGAAGIYDAKTGKMYAVANRLNPDNMVGELLHVAAHETKHQADTSGNEDLSRGSLRSFVGDEANSRFVKKLDLLAKSGNTIAQRVISAAPQNMDDKTRNLELPAYALNEAIATRNNMGAFAGLKTDLVSSIRTAAKNKLGINDVNDKDLAYLAKKLVERNALSDGDTTGPVSSQQAMIYGPKSTQFRDALRRGITFEAKDGTVKYVLTDKGSEIKPQAMTKLTNTRPGEGVRLEEVLRHPTLYDQYPQLRDMLVKSQPMKDESYGEYRWGSEKVAPYINVSPSLLAGEETMTPSGDVVNLRTALLHEIQHAVQDVEGQSKQYHRPRNLGPEEKTAVVAKQRAQSKLDSADRSILTAMDGLARGNEVDPKQKRILLSVINDNNRSASERVTEAISFLEDNNINVPDSLQTRLDTREEVRSEYNSTVPGFNAVSQKNFESYRRNTTEQDAFFTQNNADVSQEGLPINPEETYDRAVEVPGQMAMMSLPEVRNGIIKATRAARANGTEGHDSKFWNTIFGATSYAGGLGKNVRDKIDLAVGNAANISEMARHNMKNLEVGIEALAGRWVKEGKAANKEAGIKQVNAMLARRIAALQAIDSVNRRENGIAALVQQYPELRPFARSMSDIRELTEALVKQHRDATPNPTPKDIKFQQDLLDNVLSYTTRMYGAFQGPDGRAHSRKMLKDAKKAAEKMAANKNLKPAEKEAYDTVNTAVQYLIDNDIAIPDRDVLDTMRDSKLNDLYNTWMPQQAGDVRAIAETEGREQGMTVKDAEAYATQTIREQLDQKRPSIKPDELTQKADAAVRELLRLRSAQGPVAQRYAGLDVDRGIFKKRSEVPKEIRDLLGEIRDPVTMLGVTQAKQGELLARNKLLMQLKDAGLVVTQDKANTPEFAAFTERLTGEGAGPLKDQYTTPRVAAAINNSIELYSQVSDAVANAWLDTDGVAQAGLRGAAATVKWGAGKAKVLSLIAEGFGTAANALGSPIMLAANGVIDPRTAYRGAMAGLNSIADVLFDGKGDVSPLLARGIKYQVVDSARVQELRRSSQKYIKRKLSSAPKAVGGLKKGLGTGWATAVETFAMSDAWVKLAALDDRSKYLANFYKAEGIKKTPGEIDEEAANDIRDSNITYSKTPPILRTGESYGLTTFLPYFYNVPRSLARSMYLGGQDLMRAKEAKTPEGRNAALLAGTKRVIGTSAAMAAVPAMTMTMAGYLSRLVMPGDDEDEKNKKLEAMKKTLARESRFGDPVYLGQDKKDRPVFFRASRFDPYGPVTDLVRIALDDNITAEEAADQMGTAISSLIFTNRFTGAALETVGGQIPTNTDTRLERTFPKLTTAVKDVIKPVVGFTKAKAAMRLLDSFAPGIVDAVDPANTGVVSGGSEMSELLSKTVVGIGGRLDKGDPAARARTLGFEINDRRKKAREELFDAVSSRSSPEAMEKIIRDASLDIYDDMSQLSDVYEGATEGMGLSPRQTMAILKEEGKLNANEIANIRRGIPKSYETEDLAIELGRILSKKSIEQRSKKRERFETKEEVDKFNEETNELIKRLKSRGYKENK